jgi:hypothetical protein
MTGWGEWEWRAGAKEQKQIPPLRYGMTNKGQARVLRVGSEVGF